jgi:hypothetical protein
MNHPTYEHRGGCHCGNLAQRLHLPQAPEDTPLSACRCSFFPARTTRGNPVAGLGPAIHVSDARWWVPHDVDARDEPGQGVFGGL